VCVARHLLFTEGTSQCNASVNVDKTFGTFLELAIISEIGKEADDSERRLAVIRGSFGDGLDETKERRTDWCNLFV